MTLTSKTSEYDWLRFLKNFPRYAHTFTDALVLAPHPDDETLGAGGLIAALAQDQIPVQIITVTNGENAYPYTGEPLSFIRQIEQQNALRELGVDSTKITYLNLQDSGVLALEKELEASLSPHFARATHVIAPWVDDFHPDHKAVGKVATKLASQYKIKLTYYFFWTWHQLLIADVKDLPLKIFPLDKSLLAKKSNALKHYKSQINYPADNPILTDELLTPATRAFEVFLPHEV